MYAFGGVDSAGDDAEDCSFQVIVSFSAKSVEESLYGCMCDGFGIAASVGVLVVLRWPQSV